MFVRHPPRPAMFKAGPTRCGGLGTGGRIGTGTGTGLDDAAADSGDAGAEMVDDAARRLGFRSRVSATPTAATPTAAAPQPCPPLPAYSKSLGRERLPVNVAPVGFDQVV